ncbi:hypothetical protein ACQ4M4_21265 [Leptolyngbya sp. AN02str]|uniref:hypothetical protein n=1 Tax=Leptolyngbya sp. AN02str TaxID=3423363 RepID=UPI003D31B9F8
MALTRAPRLLRLTLNFWNNPSQSLICLTILVVCSLVYGLNGKAIGAHETLPNAIAALNWLETGALHFDALRDSYLYSASGSTPAFLVEAPNGHLTSAYPIGTAIISFPIYLVLWGGLHLWELLQFLVTDSVESRLNLLDPAARPLIDAFEKTAAIAIGALSVMLFYLAARLKFSPSVSLLSTFIFAFCTNTWMTGSQGLWPQGAANLVVLALILSLLKANVTVKGRRKRLLVVVGILAGLLPGILPSSTGYAVAAIAYAILAFRWEALCVLLGLPSLLLALGWNSYFFGWSMEAVWLGAAAQEAGQFAWPGLESFLTAFVGLIISPSRGLLMFSPIVWLAIPGACLAYQRRARRDELLLTLMGGAALLRLLQLCLSSDWTAGWSYGPRLVADTMPILGLLVPYTVQFGVEHWFRFNRRTQRSLSVGLSVLIVLSVFPQLVGAFGANNWNGIPVYDAARVWQWRDTQVGRHARRVYYEMTQAIPNKPLYVQAFGGVVLSLRQANGLPFYQNRIVASPNERLPLRARVYNIGEIGWFGYETGLDWGLAIAKGEFFLPDQPGVPVENPQYLYVSGNHAPGETAEAIGTIHVPQEPGTYRLRFIMVVNEATEFSRRAIPFNLDVVVQPIPVE